MVADLTLRWTLTVLFTLGAAVGVYAVAVGGARLRQLLGQGLHVVMAAAMVAMAWPQGVGLPTVGSMVFFLFATVWFVAGAVIDPDHWASNFYHAAMMFAMAWMYAVMNGGILPGQAHSGSSGGHHGGTVAAMNPGAAGPPPYIGAVNWFAAVGFGIAAVWWLCRYLVRRRNGSAGPAFSWLGELGQAASAAGMAIMFAVML